MGGRQARRPIRATTAKRMLHRHVGLASAKALSTQSLSSPVSTHVHSNGVQAVRGGYTSFSYTFWQPSLFFTLITSLKHSTQIQGPFPRVRRRARKAEREGRRYRCTSRRAINAIFIRPC